MSHVGGATCRMTPISRSALEMNLMLDTSLKATLWGKAPNEGAMTPRASSGNTRRFHTQLVKGPETP